jgi:hypothetical protein
MYPAKRPAPTGQQHSQQRRTSLDHLILGLRELEEQLPLPADRLVRDTSPASQKATALRSDIKVLSLRLTQFSRHIRDIAHSRE